MKKKIILIVSAIFGLAIAWVLLFSESFDIVITEEQAQAEIDEQIAAGPVESLGIELNVKSASIDFKANNTAELDVDFIADGFGYSGEVEGVFGSGIRYKTPEVFLDNIEPVEVKLTTDPDTAEEIQDVKNVARDFLARQRDKMLSEDAQGSLDRIVDRNTDRISQLATRVTYKFFESLPIYDLNDAGIKGSLASLALEDVRFNENSAIVTLSPKQALLKILAFLAIVCISVFMVFGSIFFKPRVATE